MSELVVGFDHDPQWRDLFEVAVDEAGLIPSIHTETGPAVQFITDEDPLAVIASTGHIPVNDHVPYPALAEYEGLVVVYAAHERNIPVAVVQSIENAEYYRQHVREMGIIVPRYELDDASRTKDILVRWLRAIALFDT